MRDANFQTDVILNTIRDGVYTLGPTGEIRWVNEKAVEEFDIGYDRDELVGMSVGQILSEDDVNKCVKIIQTLLENEDRESGRCEIALQTKYGEEIPCELHLSLLPFDDGDFQGTVGVVRDISERKEHKQRLEVLHRVLRHNLRNDINVILGYSQFLQDELNCEYEETLQTIQETGEDLIEISDKVRKLLRLQESATDSWETVDIREAVEETIESFRADYPNVNFEVQGSGQVLATIKSVTLFRNGFRHIAENAIEHNNMRSPQVRVEFETDDETTSVAVLDNGPGLPEEERKVFELESEDALHHSSGLGLWIAYWSISSSGGSVYISNRKPTGTQVTIDYPRTEA